MEMIDGAYLSFLLFAVRHLYRGPSVLNTEFKITGCFFVAIALHNLQPIANMQKTSAT